MNTFITPAILIALNILSFALMAKDKRAAQRGQRRVSESTLFYAAACFGALGGVLGMYLLRHKTNHWYFKFGFLTMLCFQIGFLLAKKDIFFR